MLNQIGTQIGRILTMTRMVQRMQQVALVGPTQHLS